MSNLSNNAFSLNTPTLNGFPLEAESLHFPPTLMPSENEHVQNQTILVEQEETWQNLTLF